MLWAVSPEWQEMFMRCLYPGFGWAGLSRDMRLVSFYSRVIGQVAENSLIIREAFDIDRIEQDLRRAMEF